MNRTTQMNRINNTNINPFQRTYRSNGSRGNYNDWKNKTAEIPKQKILGPEDFPSLIATNTKEKIKTIWQTSESNLAESVKEHLENDTLPVKKSVNLVEDFYALPLNAKNQKRVIYKEKVEEELPPIISIMPYLRKKLIKEKYRELLKRREIEEEEAAYRWQISKRMIPPMPEAHMKYLEEEDEEEDEDIQGVYQEEQNPGKRQDW